MSSLSDSATGSVPSKARAGRMHHKLLAAFQPQRLEMLDESSRHAHHVSMVRGPDAGATETHFRMLIVSKAFEGVSRVNRSRMVHDVLADELNSGLHALALTLRTPQEEESHTA
ncbi:BolA family protein [Acetobacter papayae]|uniref:BolA family protein n=1 Tax=Acetobacter papayae TaxID=1076592 RepID=UPI00047026CB|nr:BolA family protein [Acetobacter papayae]